MTQQMTETLKSRSRMDTIQAPIIAVIGDLIRQTPGTISLGQGVVHYGPPAAALKAAEPVIARTAQKGIVHRKTASRKVSRLAKRIGAMGAP